MLHLFRLFISFIFLSSFPPVAGAVNYDDAVFGNISIFFNRRALGCLFYFGSVQRRLFYIFLARPASYGTWLSLMAASAYLAQAALARAVGWLG
jgi:hypothetical protein